MISNIIMISGVWTMTLSRLACRYHRFGVTCCFIYTAEHEYSSLSIPWLPRRGRKHTRLQRLLTTYHFRKRHIKGDGKHHEHNYESLNVAIFVEAFLRKVNQWEYYIIFNIPQFRGYQVTLPAKITCLFSHNNTFTSHLIWWRK